MKILFLITSIVGSIATPVFNAVELPNSIISPSANETSLTRVANNDKNITYNNSGGGSVRYYKIVFNYLIELSALEDQIQSSNISFFTIPLKFFNYEPNANMGSATLSISWEENNEQVNYELTNETSILAPDTLFSIHPLNSIYFLSSMSYLTHDTITFTFIIPTYDAVPSANYNDFDTIKNNGDYFWYYNYYGFLDELQIESSPLPPINDDGLFGELFDILEKGFNSITGILNIRLFPNITLGTLLFMPLLFAVAYTLIKFLIGG